MHAAIKLIVGIIVFLIGVYWYAAPLFGHHGLNEFFFRSGVAMPTTFGAFVTVFAGIFGIVLIVLGLIISWIEYEDLKWASREKKSKKK
ncbi:hypothetical protein ACFLQN_00820 [Candidatus Aenigmatarchaeota archaeon]